MESSVSRPTHVVGIGGGTGLSVLLSGLRQCAEQSEPDAVDITAIVSVADDGGSTGKLRKHMGLPAVGDLRNCIVALAHGHPLWNELFQHRFGGNNGLNGHALGNLVMAALVERHGGLRAAVDRLARPLCIEGLVLPVTEERVTLCAELEDGSIVRGESRIPAGGRRIDRLWLCPQAPPPASGVIEAIEAADAVVLGPGSLYTSVLPNLLVDRVAEAIRNTGALRIAVANLGTQPGETDGFDATDHLRALETLLGPGAVDVCLVASDAPERPSERRPDNGSPATRESQPVAWDRHSIMATGAVPIAADVRARAPGGAMRHDPLRLGETVLSLARVLRRETFFSPSSRSEPLAASASLPAEVALPIAISRPK